MAYYRCMVSSGGSGGSSIILTVTCDSAFVGETLYLTKGLTVLSKTVPATGIVEFEFPESGTWVLSNSLTSDTETFENVGEYETNLYSVPDGKTVLPVNDIQIWLSCAGIRDKTYTTLAEVLADTTTLRALINSSNAVDYMVRSTSLAGDERVKVPAMTGTSTPSGTCSASSVYNNTYAFNAFDQNSSTYWWASSASNEWVGYDFEKAVIINKVSIQTSNEGGYARVKNFKIQGSNDNFSSDVHDLYIGIQADNANVQDYEFNNQASYRYYRLFVIDNYGTNNVIVKELQFSFVGITTNQTAMSLIGANDYAADTLLADETWNEAIQNSEYFESVDNAKVPVMTSNTTPSGECIGKSYYGSGYEYYKAFDGNTSGSIGSLWEGAISDGNYIGYLFGREVSIKLVKYISRDASDGNSNRNVKDFTLQNTVDGITWNNVGSAKQGAKQANNSFVITDTNSGVGYRMNITTNYGATWIDILELQFYGRQPGGVQTLLNAAGITDKDYTTLAELLNDPVSLNTVMQSEDAVDYLVTCKGWIDDIVSNQDAMSYIGLSNYASNTLLADNDWCIAICNSEYFESVLNAKVPVMTSDTEPEGQAIASSEYILAKNAFDGNAASSWNAINTPSNGWVGYTFVKECTVVKATVYPFASSGITPSRQRATTYYIQGSNDGTNWIDLDSFNGTASVQEYIRIFANANKYISYRVLLAAQNYTTNEMLMATLQFYGRKDV